MKLGIETAASLFYAAAGYVLICCYLRGWKLKEVKIRDLRPVTKGRIGYLAMVVAAYTALLLVFRNLYGDASLLHQLKLLTLVGILFPVAAADLKQEKIPNRFLLLGLILRGLLFLGELAESLQNALAVLKDTMMGVLVIGGFFLLLLLIFRNSIGMGDVKLFALMGLYQGLWGAFNAVFFSFVVSFVAAVALLATRKKSRKDVIPFGPSVLLGTILAVSLSGI